MVKSEKHKTLEQPRRIAPTAPATSHLSAAQKTYITPIITPPRSIDPCAMDLSSIKGRFAWEKITLSDTYIPVIFRYVSSSSVHFDFLLL